MRTALSPFLRISPELASNKHYLRLIPCVVLLTICPIFSDANGTELPILVTARHIKEPVMEVPFSLAVVTQEQLEKNRIHNNSDLFRSIPNFNFTDSGLTEANIVNMRGIGSASTFLSPSVTYYIDGIPVPQRAFDQEFVDIDQIEILRGPQGTLFGQNAQAGAISLRTATPGDQTKLKAGAEYGSGNKLKLSSTISGAINETLSARLSVHHLRQDGDIDNITYQNGSPTIEKNAIRKRQATGVRAKIAYDPTNETSITVSGHYQHDKRRPTTGISLLDNSKQQNYLDPVPKNIVTSSGGALKIEHDFDDMTLTSLTGYQDYKIDFSADITDGLIANRQSGLSPSIFGNQNTSRVIDEYNRQLSQEVRLNGETDNGLIWVTGLSALSRNFSSATDITNPAMANGRYKSTITGLNLSAFGEVTVPLDDHFRLITGLRFTNETTDFKGEFRGRPGPRPAVAYFSESGQTNDSFLTGRVALSADISEDLTAYATISHGAKAGGFPFYNQSAATSKPQSAFEKSTTWSYETGLKGDFWDHQLTFATSLFFNDTENEQLFIFNPLAGQFQVENANTYTYGAEIEVQARPVAGLTLTGGTSLLSTSVTEDNGQSVRKGNQTPYAPQFSAHIGASYQIPASFLNLDGNFVLQGSHNYVGSRYIDPANTLKLDDYNLTDFKLTYQAPYFDLYGYVDNAFDHRYIKSGFKAGQTGSGADNFAGVPGEGRSFGIGLKVRY